MRTANRFKRIRVTEPGPLELTGDMIDRNDVIDNSVYGCILTLAEKPDEELPWDMEIIREVTDAIKEKLSRFGIRVRHPAVVTEPDGSQHYEEYDE